MGEPFYTCTCSYAWLKALSSFLALTMPENYFGDVIGCNTYLEAILHLYMMFGMAEALTIPENAFEAVLDVNAYLEAILHYIHAVTLKSPKKIRFFFFFFWAHFVTKMLR